MLILNEQEYAKNLYEGRNNEVKSVAAKVGYVTRYLLYARGLNDSDNYYETVKWMNRNHDNFEENCYSNLIADAIKKAHKKPFFNVDDIKITKSELEIIASLDNIRAEKVLFVLLCMAKQQRIANGYTNGLVKYSLPDLFKVARVSVPTDEREYILYNIIQKGYLSYPKRNDTKCLIVNFIDDNGDEGLVINEVDSKELAYAYLNWKNNGKGYDRCEYCRKLMKQSVSRPRRFCKECSNIVGDVSDDMKVIECNDCHKLIYISVRNTKTYRCEDCQTKRDKELNREASKERMRKYRAK